MESLKVGCAVNPKIVLVRHYLEDVSAVQLGGITSCPTIVPREDSRGYEHRGREAEYLSDASPGGLYGFRTHSSSRETMAILDDVVGFSALDVSLRIPALYEVFLLNPVPERNGLPCRRPRVTPGL